MGFINQETFFLSNPLAFTWNNSVTLKMQTVGLTKTSENLNIILCKNPEDHHSINNRCDSLQTYRASKQGREKVTSNKLTASSNSQDTSRPSLTPTVQYRTNNSTSRLMLHLPPLSSASKCVRRSGNNAKKLNISWRTLKMYIRIQWYCSQLTPQAWIREERGGVDVDG